MHRQLGFRVCMFLKGVVDRLLILKGMYRKIGARVCKLCSGNEKTAFYARHYLHIKLFSNQI